MNQPVPALPSDRPAAQQSRGYRKPTGLPSWPVLLLAGREKAGKSYQAALASSSDLIDRTFWVGFGEKDPDEYGAIPGSRFEIVQHNGTLGDLTQALRDIQREPSGDRPHLLVIDSGTKIWNTLGDKANYLAVQRGAKGKDGEPIVGMDIWNRVTREWLAIMTLIRMHRGPVIITARLDTVTVMDDNGRPTKNKAEKIKGQKDLAYDVDAIVEMPERGTADLVGARSVIFKLPERLTLPDFTVDGLWRKLGLDRTATAQPTYAEPAPIVGEPQTPAVAEQSDDAAPSDAELAAEAYAEQQRAEAAAVFAAAEPEETVIR